MQAMTVQEWAEKYAELRTDLPLAPIEPYQREAISALQIDDLEGVFLLCAAIGCRETKIALMFAKVREKS